MSFFGASKPKSPAHTRWPPGVDFRYVYLAGIGLFAQLRPGARLTEEQWLVFVRCPALVTAPAGRFERCPFN